MESSSDKDAAMKYLIDPLTAPQPSEETGPGSHFNSTHAPTNAMQSPITPITDPKKSATTKVEEVGSSNTTYPTPPNSGSPRTSKYPSHRQEAFASAGPSHRRSAPQDGATDPSGHGTSGRRRGSSLSERYPGDMSHRPLDTIKKHTLRADRSRHLRKAQHSGNDSIDRLDASVLGPYHHEGPYDAASMAKNRDPKSAPLGAIRDSNAEALRATPREKVQDSLRTHRPLDGTAFVPPGYAGPDGKLMEYEEGTDMMRFGGNEYKRWEGLQYHPDDLKGKSEPAYSIERALKDHEKAEHRRGKSDTAGIELTTRPKRSSSLQVRAAGSGNEHSYAEWENDLHRGDSKSKGFGKRFGSLRKRHGRPEDEVPTASIGRKY